QAKEMSHLADGVIIGSAIIKLLERHGTAAPKFIGEYTKTISDAIA
ncbi:MAG: tryptophan synthase subunit alpha, partial [Selenomonadaceae bacterium]|nr:tryptophan synthase subunit alpha [Selenomonadaceae bacterium]